MAGISARKLKVYGMASFLRGVPGQVRVFAAARSKTEFAALTHKSLHFINEYACQTGNDNEIAIAMGSPGAVFYKPLNDGKNEHVKQWRTE